MMPWPGFELRVALRFLREGRMQTLLIIVGVAAGVAVIAYISALISGLQGNTLNKTLGAQAHVTLRSPDDRGHAGRAGAARHHRAHANPAAGPAPALGGQLAGAGAIARTHAGHCSRVAHGGRRRPGPARRSHPGHLAHGRGAGPLRPHRGPARQGGQRQCTPFARRGHRGPRPGGGPGRARGRPPDGADRHGERFGARDRAGGPGGQGAEPPHRDRAAARRAEPAGPARAAPPAST
jgi:hypothetical protein